MSAELPQTTQLASGIWESIRERQGSFVVGSWITIVLNGLSILLYGVGSILVARALGPRETGYLAWFITGTTIFAMFADVLGIYYSNAYLTARKDLPFGDPVIRGTVLTYGGLVGLTVGILFAGVMPLFRMAFHGFPESGWPQLVFLNLFGTVLVNQIRGLYWGKKSFILLGLLSLLKSGGYGVLAVLCAYGLGWKRGNQIAVTQVVANWACVLASAVYFLKRGIAQPQIGYLQACLKVGWRAAGINWLSFLHQRVDQYIVNTMLGQAALGLYGVAVSVGELVTQVPGMIGMVLFPLAAEERDEASGAKQAFTRTLLVMAVVALLMIPLGLFAPAIIRGLFGPSFAGSVTLLRFFLPGVVFLSGLLLVNNHISGLGYPIFQLWAMAFALAGNIGLNLVLLPRLNVTGAPIASSVSYGFWFVLVVAYLGRKASVTQSANLVGVATQKQSGRSL